MRRNRPAPHDCDWHDVRGTTTPSPPGPEGCGTDLVGLGVAGLSLAEHLHAWVLKGFHFKASDMAFFLILQKYAYHVLLVARRICTARALAHSIDRRFSDASVAQLHRRAEDVCPICLKGIGGGGATGSSSSSSSSSSRVKQLPCAHLLHKGCLLQVLEKGGLRTVGDTRPAVARCPLCRCSLEPAKQLVEKTVLPQEQDVVDNAPAHATQPQEDTVPTPTLPPPPVHDPMAAAAAPPDDPPLFQFSTHDLPFVSALPFRVPQFTFEVIRRRPRQGLRPAPAAAGPTAAGVLVNDDDAEE